MVRHSFILGLVKQSSNINKTILYAYGKCIAYSVPILRMLVLNMKLFFDESGDFSLKNEPYGSFVGCLICPDSSYQEVIKFHSEVSKGVELKGSGISNELRYEICNYISNCKAIRIGLTLISNEHNSDYDIVKHREKQVVTYQKCKNSYIQNGGTDTAAIKHYNKIIKIMEKPTLLSRPEYLQWTVTQLALIDALQYSISYYIANVYEPDFKTYEWIFDRKQPNALSAYEKFVKQNWSVIIHTGSLLEKLYVIETPKTWKGNHIFDTLYGTPNGINLKKIFDNGLAFNDSKKEPLIQFIDVITNTFFLQYNRRYNKDIEKCYNLLLDSVCGEYGKKIVGIGLNRN